VLTTDPWILEAIAQTDVFDYVEFSAEYSPYTLRDLDAMCRTADVHHLDLMIKVDLDTHQFASQHAISSGFSSVLFADIHDVDEARSCIRSIRPDTPEDGGTHGSRGRRFRPGFGGSPAYLDSIRDVVCMLMIEKRGAVEHLEAILALPGLDMIQWGPGDYSVSIGRAGESGAPEIKDTERRVLETAIAHGIRPRAEISTPELASWYLDRGVKDFALGTDLYILYDWLRGQGSALRDLMRAAS
jgi:4-hydroxy-2-oxoheptanedioate aldolase